jgi:hypothetical protein
MRQFDVVEVIFGVIVALVLVALVVVILLDALANSTKYEPPCDRPAIYSSVEMFDCLNREIHELQTKVARGKQ